MPFLQICSVPVDLRWLEMDARTVQSEHIMTLRIVLPVLSVQLEQHLKTMGLSTSGNVVGIFIQN